MSTSVTYVEARANLDEILDRAVATGEPVIVRRRGKEPIAVLPARELESLMETLHLLRSPRNAGRLFAALERARREEGESQTVEALRTELCLREA